MKQTLTDRLESTPIWLLTLISLGGFGLSLTIAWYQPIHLLFIGFALLTAIIIYLLLDIEAKKFFKYFTLAIWIGSFICWVYLGLRSVFLWECLAGTDGQLLGSTKRCQTGELYLSILTIPVIYQIAYWNRTHVQLQPLIRRVLQVSALSAVGVLITQVMVYLASAIALFATVWSVVFN
jgi:hypothetical protein